MSSSWETWLIVIPPTQRDPQICLTSHWVSGFVGAQGFQKYSQEWTKSLGRVMLSSLSLTILQLDIVTLPWCWINTHTHTHTHTHSPSSLSQMYSRYNLCHFTDDKTETHRSSNLLPETYTPWRCDPDQASPTPLCFVISAELSYFQIKNQAVLGEKFASGI